MDLHSLKPARGSIKQGKRIARGQGSGRGGTSTKGHKGSQSRAGYKRRFGYEGGQMPLQRRLPKFGFKNVNRKEYRVFNLSKVQYLIEKYNVKEFDLELLKTHRLIKRNDLVKILANGELKSKVEIKVHAFSEAAKKAVEAAGGSIAAIENKKRK
ncbi:MAG: 50S ribosomal protein L15 [Bacteroidetes bacterium]|nr:50S ribosomal protein L15 [Bacteroidota bacterium]